MKAKRITVGSDQRFVVVFGIGDEVIAGLQKFAAEQSLDASSFTAIGAFERARLGFFDLQRKEYAPIPIDEQVEVVSLIGDIALDQGKPKIHAHVVVAKRDGTAHGGHLLEAWVRPTLELVLVESPASLARKTDPATGLGLISLDDSQ
jgi:predicted DNA-binding protein with PD1-like motif